MPELPEVEALRRGLVQRVKGQTIKHIIVHKPKLVSGKGTVRTASGRKKALFIRELTGQQISDISRRAKNLIFRFESGKIMLVHLKMTGQFVYREHSQNMVIGGHPIEISEHELPNKHTHIIFQLTKGMLYYNDTRMFGYLLFFPSLNTVEDAHFGSLGLEPMDKAFTPEYFTAALQQKRGTLKTVLMNQGVVTGLGNIYADEVCFAAGVRPTRLVASLTKAEIEKLYRAIRQIMPRAIKLGGSSVATYRLADGSRGNYAREHKVYGKSGKNCSVCKHPLTKTTVNNRTTVYCKHCQK